MPNLGDTITLDLPTVRETRGPTYARKVNDALTDLKEILEQKVPFSSLRASEHLSLRDGSDYYGINDAEWLGVVNNTAAPTGIPACALYFDDDELYVKDGAGNLIALTASGAATGDTATNGIITVGSPAYNASGQIIEWDGTSSYYSFYDASSSFSDVRAKRAFLTADDTNFVQLTSPSISSDITLTLPDVASGTIEVLGINSSGVITANPTLDGLTIKSGDDITLQGAGRIKGSVHTMSVACANLGSASDGDSAYFDGNTHFVSKEAGGASSDVWWVCIPIPSYATVTTWAVYINKAGTTQTDANLWYVTGQGTATQIGATQSTTSSGNQTLTQGSLTHNHSINEVLMVGITGGDTGDKYYNVVVTYTTA